MNFYFARVFWAVLIYFNIFGAASSISSPESQELLRTLTLAAGVYADGKVHNGLNLNKTVIITGGNYGYLNHLHNFKCFMDLLGFKFLVFSMDQKTHDYVNNLDKNMYSYHWKSDGAVKEESTIFRSPQFHIITNRKKEAVLGVLELGFDAIFIDPDIALVRDPLPQLLWKNVDYVHSLNKICPQCYDWDFYKSEEEGNTGFYYVRSNPKTIKLWTAAGLAAPKNPGLDDQSIFWEIIRSKTVDPPILPLKQCQDHNITDDTRLVTCPLDGCMFSAGALRGVAYTWLKENLEKRHNKAYSIHANYYKGNELKMKALEKHGYWLTYGGTAPPTGRDDKKWLKCKPFTAPF